MTLYAIAAYLKYRWAAKNRHGVHSPFAYAFVEDVIENRKQSAIKITDVSGLLGTDKYNALVSGMMAYYRFDAICAIPVPNSRPVPDQQLLLVMAKMPPQEWNAIIDGCDLASRNNCLLITGIHQSAAHAASWKRVCAHPKVRMSMDLYGIGLLFFKEEFKERQHFVLRY